MYTLSSSNIQYVHIQRWLLEWRCTQHSNCTGQRTIYIAVAYHMWSFILHQLYGWSTIFVQLTRTYDLMRDKFKKKLASDKISMCIRNVLRRPQHVFSYRKYQCMNMCYFTAYTSNFLWSYISQHSRRNLAGHEPLVSVAVGWVVHCIHHLVRRQKSTVFDALYKLKHILAPSKNANWFDHSARSAHLESIYL